MQTELSNGLTVIIHETHVAPVASFWIFYRVGSRNELPGLTGVSHWVEHMLFKGTETYPRGQFDKAVARAGGIFNGMTSQDCTVYFETFPAERIDLALQVESDRMANATFDSAETEAERTVIISEREGSENSSFYLLSEEVQAVAHQVHSYRHPIIGWKHDLETITRDELYEHYRTYYTPNNAVVVAVGDIETQDMFARIEDCFGPHARGPVAPPVRTVEPAQSAERRVVMTGNEPTAYFVQTFHAPPAVHDDFFPLVVMDSVLGGAKGLGIFGGGVNSRSNRLYRALVDTELAVSVGTAYRPTIDPDLFSFFVTLAPDVSHEQIERAIWAEIEKVQQEGIQAQELEKAIKQTRAQFAYSSESVTHQAYWYGFSEVVASSIWFANWRENLEAVTAADVMRVAQTYFSPRQQTIGWYLPEPGSSS